MCADRFVWSDLACDPLGRPQYEELLVEMGDYSTPFQKSPPWVQLLVLLTFNTALFVANAILEKLFHVDILPVVGMMTGAGPLDPAASPRPASKPAAAAAAAKPSPAPAPTAAAPASSAFAAFASNF